ncbi:MAG: HNH nuclease family protein [Desulfobacteraceae bacterium]|nr:MAG: HNH nuclease family protein [Desulfobacteraceae bacterium]
MSQKKTETGTGRLENIAAAVRRERELREKTYRERALKLFPHVCGKCGREFTGRKLKELTVHHRDHDHENNPPDGSNWELLCIYCHDNEHSRSLDAQWYGAETPDGKQQASSTHKPFEGLEALLKVKKLPPA